MWGGVRPPLLCRPSCTPYAPDSPARAHQRGIGLCRQARRFFGERRAGAMNCHAAEQPFRQLEVMMPLPGYAAENPDGFARDFLADAVAGQNQYVEVHLLARHRALRVQAFLNQRFDFLIHESFFSLVGDRGETVVKRIELLAVQLVAQAVGPLVERVAPAVLA